MVAERIERSEPVRPRRLQAAWDGLKGRAWSAVGRRIVWVTDSRRDAFGQPGTAAALVAVLGREHYTERRKAYPIRGWRDLSRVLRVELAGAPPTLTLIGPLVEDRREVTLFELAPAALEQAGRALAVVPESLLVAGTLPAQRVASVDRDGLKYFVASSGVSQVAGGAVVTPALFAIAAGMDEELPALDLDRSEVNRRILQGLLRLPPAAWLRLVNPSLDLDLGLAWRPLLTLAGVGLAACLLLASGYLSVTQSLRERELAALGPEVASLMDAHREVERLGAEQASLAGVLREREPTYPVWRIAASAWQKGALLNGLSIVDGLLTLRGSAPAATAVLEALAADKAVTEARFSAPVRQVGDREQFVITLRLGTDGSHD